MKMLLIPFLVTTLTLNAGAVDRCEDRCTSTQICTDDGICVNRTDLVKCGAWPLSYYCHKGHECCGFNGCMPAGAVCCGSIFYCPSGHTCCETKYCCAAGTFCDGNGNCVLDKYSTRKPPTRRWNETRTPSKTARTLYPTTRTRWNETRTPSKTTRTLYPTTRTKTPFPNKTTRWFHDYTTTSSFRISHTSTSRWLYGVVIGGVVVTVAIIIAVVIWNSRNSASNAPCRSDTGGTVSDLWTFTLKY
ncbi:uncharacterized protein LOC128545949 [Mercenaria mercenaria]|uniref:uncharacterized protein LOC128545949 n=1 Tax=Mercenaria mercenaria TaxID=6596 RepID=UPI00234F4FE9|nr:uncharacterized protein LOC128545949 [Mercenaria mercenaria]